MSDVIEPGRADRPELSTGQLVAIAAAACGAAAWVFQKLTEGPEDEAVSGAPVDLRGRLHALADSDTVRSVERRGNELAPVVQSYRERAGQLAGMAGAEGAKRLTDAEKRLATQRRQSGRAIQRTEKRLGKRVDRTRRMIETAPVALAGMVDTGREQIRSLEKSAGARADDLRKTTSGLTGEVTTMTNQHVKRLQERGQGAADAIGATLRDSTRDTSSRIADVRDQVVALAKTSSGDVEALLHDVTRDARKNLPDVAKTVSDRASEIGHQVADSASRAGQTVSDRAAGASDRVPGGSDAVGRAQSALSDATQKAAAIAGPAIEKASGRLGHLSDDLRDDPSALRSRLVEQGQGALKSIQGQAAQTAKDLVPIAKQAGTVQNRAQDRASEARDRGLDLAALLQSNVPSFLAQVTDMIDQTSGRTGSQVSDARKQAAKAVDGAEDGLQSALDRLGEAAKRAAQVGDQAVAASSHFRGSTRNAAHRTADAGKDGFESVIWLGAAGVAMYYGVLSPEQRATVNKVGLKVGRGLGKVIGEIRGQDQKF